MNQTVIFHPSMKLDELIKLATLYSFQYYRGNKTQTSIALGISVRTLENYLKEYEEDGKKQFDADQKRKLDADYQLQRARGLVRGPETQGPHIFQATPGNGVESTSQASPQQAVSLPESEKVQSVLPKSTTASGHQRRGR